MHMPYGIWIVLFSFTVLLAFYSFLHRDFENYTHALSAFVAGVLNIMLGANAYIGIVFTESNIPESEYVSEYFAYFHIIWGGILLLLFIIHSIDITKRVLIEKQIREEHELTGGR